jgi:hypothetical protein
MTGRRSAIKGFKVSKTKSGKTILEPIPGYGLSASARIVQKNSKAVKPTRRVPG